MSIRKVRLTCISCRQSDWFWRKTHFARNRLPPQPPANATLCGNFKTECRGGGGKARFYEWARTTQKRDVVREGGGGGMIVVFSKRRYIIYIYTYLYTRCMYIVSILTGNGRRRSTGDEGLRACGEEAARWRI